MPEYSIFVLLRWRSVCLILGDFDDWFCCSVRKNSNKWQSLILLFLCAIATHQSLLRLDYEVITTLSNLLYFRIPMPAIFRSHAFFRFFLHDMFFFKSFFLAAYLIPSSLFLFSAFFYLIICLFIYFFRFYIIYCLLFPSFSIFLTFYILFCSSFLFFLFLIFLFSLIFYISFLKFVISLYFNRSLELFYIPCLFYFF